MDNINFIYLERAAKAFDRCINDATTGSVARALYNAKEVVLSEVETMYNVQPVKRGKWLPSDSYITTAYGTLHCEKCSECGAEVIEGDDYDNDFCPCCGARMDGDNVE